MSLFPTPIRRWWVRPCGGRQLLQLAMPLVLSTASWAIMHFLDRMFLFWHSHEETGAAFSSGTLLWSIMALPLGIASFLNTFVSQYHGAGRPRRIGVALFQGVFFGWATVPLFLLLMPLTHSFFQWLNHPTELSSLEATYFEVNLWGAGAAVLAAAYSSFYTGLGRTRVVMVIDVLAACVDCVLNYLWIFGKLGFPEMGIAGAAWSSVLGQWLKIAIYLWLLRAPRLRQTYGLDEGRRLDFDLLRRLIRYGVPNGFQMQLEGLAFTIFAIYIARLGTFASAATTLAISINIMAFVPMMGLGIAVSTMVGQQLGANRPRLAIQAVWSGIWLSLAYNAVFAVLYLVTPHIFLAAHQAGASGHDVYTIRDLTIVLLRFVAAYCLFDAVQLTFCSALKGAGDTRYVLLTTVITSAGAVALIEWGITQQGWQLMWCWTVLVLWIVALALAYTIRFLQGGWTRLRVIEPDLAEVEETEASWTGT